MRAGVEARRRSARCSPLVPPGQGTCSHPAVQLERSGWARKAGTPLGGRLPIQDAAGCPTTFKSAPLRVPRRGLEICTQPSVAKCLSRGTCYLQRWCSCQTLPASELESASLHPAAEAAFTKLGLPSKVSFATTCLSLWLNSHQACVRDIKAEEREEEDILAYLFG